MKKILSLIVILVAFGASVSAVNPRDYSIFYKLNNASTFSSIVRYLDADKEQADQLKYVFSLTENKLNSSLKADNENSAQKALMFNLANAKAILSESQYRKYLTMLNVSVYNEKVTLLAINE
ncbi:hypothetical protein Palpr_0733 [Paludibacter propionicigenes WB4]|uniref:DUF3347 domain-containing protein n=1 Tax=Paludibacter propionicigenes (strain DSM 17365 / JCM 13257 / WB4) TaxID=694427 RepID=E4T2E5_PALPW|nr:hypothetical protein [Paludibacter propionicigenes]ADQ78889.1 hypothetical protein Palpr_0733 [Paludibacter propionicigenes WB4]